MSTHVRFDGRRVVDHDINGSPILEGRALPLPRYDRPTHDEIRIKFEKRANAAKVAEYAAAKGIEVTA